MFVSETDSLRRAPGTVMPLDAAHDIDIDSVPCSEKRARPPLTHASSM